MVSSQLATWKMQSGIRTVQHKQSWQNQWSLLDIEWPATLGCSFRCLNANQQMTGFFEAESFVSFPKPLKKWFDISLVATRELEMQGVNSWLLLCSEHLEGWFVQILQPIKPQHKTAARKYSLAFYTSNYPVVSLDWSQARKTSKAIAINTPEQTCRMDKSGSCRRNTGVSSS